MKNLSREWGNKEPHYELHPIETKIIFESQIKESTYIEEGVLEKLNERQKKAIEYIKEKGGITSKVYQEINELGKVYSIKELNEMVAKKILKKAGKGKNVKYELW